MKNNNLFDRYYDLLIEWNNKFNLTSVTEREEVNVLHFRDSLTARDYIEKGATVLDVGSGAGFPGIPLKIEREDLVVTLLDSVNKKVTFMCEVIKALGLENIKAVHSRIEEYKERNFDAVVSRAVAPLNTLVEYCLPFVKRGGVMIAYKGRRNEEEELEAKAAIELLGGKIREAVRPELMGYERTLYIIEKIGDSPSGYPRSGNKPRLKPIR